MLVLRLGLRLGAHRLLIFGLIMWLVLQQVLVCFMVIVSCSGPSLL